MSLILPEPESTFWWREDAVMYGWVKDFSAHLGHAKKNEVYWSPALGRPLFRSLTCKREPNALPPDAALVGNFTHPCPRDVFAEALRETINEQANKKVAA